MSASRAATRVVVHARGHAWRCARMREALARRAEGGADAYPVVRGFADLWKDYARLADASLRSIDAGRAIRCQVDSEVIDLLLCDLLWRAQGLTADCGEIRPKLELLARKFESVAEILDAARVEEPDEELAGVDKAA